MEGPYQVCEPLTSEEYEALKASIEEHGVRAPIEVDEEGNILDGHNRAEIARALQIPCPTTVKAGLGTSKAKREYARTMNAARRQMTPEKKRKMVEDQLREDPELSNRWIAEIAGVDTKTVIEARTRLERTVEIPQLTELRGKDGKMRPAEQTKPERFPWMNGLGWEDWHRMEARHHLRQLEDAEKDVVSQMVARVGSAPTESLKVLGGFVRQPADLRRKIVGLWTSNETRSQDRAISLVSGLPRVPDPRIALLEGGYDYVTRAAKAFPDDTEVADLRLIAVQIRGIARSIEEKGQEE